MMNKFSIVAAAMAAVLPGLVLAGSTSAVSVPYNAVSAPHYAASLSPAQRGAAIATFVRKWGPYVQSVYGTDVKTWAQRMVTDFAHGDADNIQRALQRTTFDGAIAELNGYGGRRTDAQLTIRMASFRAPGDAGAALLGDATADTVYTPINPCRIADTRVTGGPIAAGTNRGFGAWGYADYAGFGGSTTNCNVYNEHPAAVALNVTVIGPAAAGYSTVYRGDLASPPGIASINYVTGQTVNNALVVAISQNSRPDYKIYSLRQANYVVDIVGYFDTPHATALDCTTVNSAPLSVVNGDVGQVLFPGCGFGYSRIAFSCETGAFDTPLSGSSANFGCLIRNNAGSTVNLTAISTCCRVPGR